MQFKIDKRINLQVPHEVKKDSSHFSIVAPARSIREPCP